MVQATGFDERGAVMHQEQRHVSFAELHGSVEVCQTKNRKCMPNATGIVDLLPL